MPKDQPDHLAEKYAADYIRQLRLNSEVEQKCEWSCLLWLKEHWASQAQRSKLNLQQAKEQLHDSAWKTETLESLFFDSQFSNTVAQIYSKLFNVAEESCTVKNFPDCPFMSQRDNLLRKGLLANSFVTILQKATSFAMLDRHPLDSGLLHEEYTDVYGIDLTNFTDLEASLSDGRFEKLFGAVVERGSQLAGIASKAAEQGYPRVP